jgi:hypothetical protein
MPGGGLGFTRVPSLISIWSTAPFLLNNRLGPPFDDNPSVDTRMKIFDASIEQLLWPEKRERDEGFEGKIIRTNKRSWLKIPMRDVPEELANISGAKPGWVSRALNYLTSLVFDNDAVLIIGPIPKGVPINLANYRPLVDFDPKKDSELIAKHVANVGALAKKLVESPPPLLLSLTSDVESLRSDEEILDWWKSVREPLLNLSKCPDLVVNKGHYFGTAKFNETEGLSEDEKSFVKEPEPVLSDDDKRALIEFIKTF